MRQTLKFKLSKRDRDRFAKTHTRSKKITTHTLPPTLPLATKFNHSCANKHDEFYANDFEPNAIRVSIDDNIS
ncbi:hypothetical protein [uncultured Campylobacter sp.]|uniref:hypothetical protein n=1 Tax=uncultured Campylobacter sp. TaxID=218934 RepID=UPI00260BE886|nr:hypothetical protein [uncultured Campylobacter sp.]